MDQPQLPGDVKKVLSAVREQSMDGYSLVSRTGLDFGSLATAIEQLRSMRLLRVTGSLAPDAIGDTVFSVPVDAIGQADIVLGHIRPDGYR